MSACQKQPIGLVCLFIEKKVPHCKLSVVKTMVEADKVRATKAAREGGAAIGFDFDGMLAVVMGLSTTDFYKSMTTHADHRIWQDVYRPTTSAGGVYLKLTVIDDVIIVSFKEL
jgi:motility quorum-sensing regulator/GCU-specific mRNA interferase toxin